jgi:hypothetical protein
MESVELRSKLLFVGKMVTAIPKRRKENKRKRENELS